MFYVYLLASRKQGTLYLGVTKDLVRRTYQHGEKILPGFTSHYDIRRLVWYEIYDEPTNAITRKKKSRSGGARGRSHLSRKISPTGKIYIPISQNRVASGFRVRAFGAPRNDGHQLAALIRRSAAARASLVISAPASMRAISSRRRSSATSVTRVATRLPLSIASLLIT